jgi:hypothetical protein
MSSNSTSNITNSKPFTRLQQQQQQLNTEESDGSTKSDSSKKRPRSPSKIRQNRSKMTKPTASSESDDHGLVLPSEKLAYIMNQLAKIDKIDDLAASMKRLEERMDESEKQIADIKESISASNKRFKTLRKSTSKIHNELEALKRENNQLAQQSLRNEFAIFGLPTFESSKSESVVNSLAKVSNVNFSLRDLKSFRPFPLKSDKKQCVIRGEFYNEQLKANFMSSCRAKTPITVEDIFELAQDDTRRGKQVFVTHQLSRSNQLIKSEARRQKAKGKLAQVWEDHGKVLVRLEDNSPSIHILSMQQLMEMITSNNGSETDDDDEPMDQQ